MQATVMYRAGDVRVERVPDATIVDPADAVVRVIRACICGSDLWPYRSMEPNDAGRRMGRSDIWHRSGSGCSSRPTGTSHTRITS